MNVVWLAADHPDEGERQANEAMEGWSHKGFHRQHYSHALARIQTELYRGDAEAAWRLVAGNWPAFARTLLLRIQFVRIEASLSAGARRAAQRVPRTRRRALSVDRTRRRPAHRALRAALVGGDRAAAQRRRDLSGGPVRRRTRDAGRGRDRVRARGHAHAAAARRRLGAAHDERGRALVADADAWMAAQGIRNPARMTRLIAPGFPDPEGT